MEDSEGCPDYRLLVYIDTVHIIRVSISSTIFTSFNETCLQTMLYFYLKTRVELVQIQCFYLTFLYRFSIFIK